MGRIDTGEFARMWLGGLGAGLQAHQHEQSLGLSNRSLAMQGRENDRRHALAQQQMQENAQYRQMQQQGYEEDRAIRRMQLMEAHQRSQQQLQQWDATNRVLQAINAEQPEQQPGMVGPGTPHPVDQLTADDLRYASPQALSQLGDYRRNSRATRDERDRTAREIDALRSKGGARLVASAMAANGDLYQRAARTGLWQELADDELPTNMLDVKQQEREQIKEAMITSMVITADDNGMPVLDEAAAAEYSRLPLEIVQDHYRLHVQARAAEQQRRQQQQWEAQRDEETAQLAVRMAPKRGEKLTIEEARDAVRARRLGLTPEKAAAPTRPTAHLAQAVKDSAATYGRLNVGSDGKTKGFAPPTEADYRAASGEGWHWSGSREKAREKVAAFEEYQRLMAELARLDGQAVGDLSAGDDEDDEIERAIREAMGGQRR